MTDPIRIMWVNPVGISHYDEPIADLLAGVAREGTEVETVSFNEPAGLNNLEYRSYSALALADTVRAARYAGQNNYDAFVIGCFYDPGIEAAREVSGETIVVAPCQASIQIVLNLCRKFSVIVGQEKWVEEMTDRVEIYGAKDRLASMRSIDIAVPDLQSDCSLTSERIIDAGRKAVEIDGAEALLLGCTCTFGLFEEVQRELGVPVIDPIFAAFKMAEFLAEQKRRFNWIPSRVGGAAAPPEHEIKAMGLFQTDPKFGKRVIRK